MRNNSKNYKKNCIEFLLFVVLLKLKCNLCLFFWCSRTPRQLLLIQLYLDYLQFKCRLMIWPNTIPQLHMIILFSVLALSSNIYLITNYYGYMKSFCFVVSYCHVFTCYFRLVRYSKKRVLVHTVWVLS